MITFINQKINIRQYLIEMNKQRRNASYSSNLFRNVNRRLRNLNCEIDRYKNYFDVGSNLLQVEVLKPHTESYKQNLQPMNKHTKINSFRLHHATIKTEIYKSKTISLKLKDIEPNQSISRFCKKITIKYSEKVQKKQWTFIIDSEIFFHPKKFWNKATKIREISRIKPQIKQFISHLNTLSTNIAIVFRVRNQQQLLQVQNYLVNHNIDYHSVFYVPNKYIQSVTLYNLQQINQISDKIVILQQKLKNTSMLPILTMQSQIIALYIEQICLANKKYVIQGLGNNQISINTNFACRFELNSLELGYKLKLEKINLQKKIFRRVRCKSIEHININCLDYSNKMQIFKEKMVKYIKLIQQQKHQQNICNNSKTPNQIIAQLARLNMNNSRQIQTHVNKFKDINPNNVDIQFSFAIPMYLIS